MEYIIATISIEMHKNIVTHGLVRSTTYQPEIG